MQNYFQVRIRVTKVIKAKSKRVFEVYLVKAYSFTEAEANITKALVDRENYKSMTISSIDRFQIDSVYNFDFENKYWICKVDMNSVGDTKPIKLRYLVNSKDANTAAEEMRNILNTNSNSSNHEIVSIQSSQILEIFEEVQSENSESDVVH